MIGCDQGPQHVQSTLGPPIHLVGQNIAPDQPLPIDVPIRLAFDRLLNPLTVTRQSFVVRDAFGNALAPVVQYDPVGRVVVLANPNVGGQPWLLPGQPYTVTMGIPGGASDVGGIRAIDHATLDPAQTLTIGFETLPAIMPPPPPPMHFCVDVLPILQGKCSASACHGSPQVVPSTNPNFPDGHTRPAAGLVLDSVDGIRFTAVNRVSQGSNTGPLAGTGSSPLHEFGIDMPIVDPGDPGHSWLMYKLLLAPQLNQSEDFSAVCQAETTAGHVDLDFDAPPDGGASLAQPLSDGERAILSNFVLGREMPYPSDPSFPEPATSTDNPPPNLDELERIRAWIAEGRSDPGDFLEDCSVCIAPPPPASDAGASDASDAAVPDAPGGG